MRSAWKLCVFLIRMYRLSGRRPRRPLSVISIIK
ncbi:unnamed protein product [Tenebrio molitor]|nr:unnamed protein product [Tenebrio molitor]